ncbi:hypothetical protein KIPB_013930, partial [Kipferlia bialata]
PCSALLMGVQGQDAETGGDRVCYKVTARKQRGRRGGEADAGVVKQEPVNLLLGGDVKQEGGAVNLLLDPPAKRGAEEGA